MRHEIKWTSSIILLRGEKFLRHGYLEETVELDSWRDPRGVEQEIERFDRERVKRRKWWAANNRSIFPLRSRKNLGPMSRSPL